MGCGNYLNVPTVANLWAVSAFKKKLMPDDTIEKYKAWLVAKCYTHHESEDYFNTYSPITRLTTIRVLLFLAASYGLIVHQMDIKRAFLNRELEVEMYIDQFKIV